MVAICNACNRVFKNTQGLSKHKSQKIPCIIKEELKCKRCGKIFRYKHHLTQHYNRKNPCQNLLEQANLEIMEKEKEMIDYKTNATLKILKATNEYKKELIELQKEKELAIEEKKSERKKQVSIQTTINNIAQQINFHFPISTTIPATYEECSEKIVSPFIERITSGSYNSYKLIYESSLNKFEISTIILKEMFQDEKKPNTHNMVYITEQDIFMVALHKAWVYKQFGYIAKIISDAFKRCFSAIVKKIGEPMRVNFMSDIIYNKACIRYQEIMDLSKTDISAEDLENISKEGLSIDDILSGKKILNF